MKTGFDEPGTQIEALLHRLPRQLSGGQRQRVAMGCAIVRNPSVFMFDEPLSNLDAKLRVEMPIEIRKLHNVLETTSIYVTHDQVEAMTLADRIVLMNAGLAEQIGTPLDLYERPNMAFVAGFIGSRPMNLLKAEVGEKGQSLVLAGGTAVKLTVPVAPDWSGRAVTVGIRPERLRLDDSTAGISLPLEVELIERHGADSVLHGVLPNRSRAEVMVRLAETPTIPQPERVEVKLRETDIHLFDGHTGARLERRPAQAGS